MRFHDGSPLTPADVVLSLERARNDSRSTLRVALAGVETIEAVRDDGVLLRTRERDAFLAPRLAEVPIASRRCLEDESSVAAGRASCGTGPYRVASRRAGDYVDLQRHEGYRDGVPPIERVRFVAPSFGSPDKASLVPQNALLLFWARPGSPEAATARAHFASWNAPGLAMLYLSFTLRAPQGAGAAGPRPRPFLDPRVREAVARAVASMQAPPALSAAYPAGQPVRARGGVWVRSRHKGAGSRPGCSTRVAGCHAFP